MKSHTSLMEDRNNVKPAQSPDLCLKQHAHMIKRPAFLVTLSL